MPGTSALIWSGFANITDGFILSKASGLPEAIDTILAADRTLQPSVVIMLGLNCDGDYVGSGATITLGGNAMDIVVASAAGGTGGAGRYNQTVLALLAFDAGTSFPDATLVLDIPGVISVHGAVVRAFVFYHVDPTLNHGWGAGYASAVQPYTAGLSVGPVTALAGDVAFAVWTKAFGGGYGITAPADVVEFQNSGTAAVADAYGSVGSSGAYLSTADAFAGGSALPTGLSLVGLLRGVPPSAIFVPDIIGDPLATGEAALVAVGLLVGVITTAASYTVAAGDIIATVPGPGAETFPGHIIAIVISSGPPPLWALTPDWATPVREKLGFLTDVLPAWTGYEQRRALRIAPRRVFSFSTLASAREKRYIENTLFAWSALEWAIPIFPDGQLLPDPISVSDTTIACDTVNRDFVNGGLAVVIQDAMFAEVFLISTVASNLLTLSSPAIGAWPAGSRLYPVRSALLLTYPKILHESQEIVSISIDFTIDEPCDWPAASGLPTYRTLPVLEDSPDVSTAPAGDYLRLANITDSTTGAIDIDDTAQLGFPGIVHNWYLRGRTARSNFRKLLYLLKGRAGMIWIPSYNADLVLIGSLGSAAVAMTVEAAGLTRLAAVQNRRDIRIELLTGTVYYRRIASAAPGMTSATEVVTLDTALGVTIAAAQVRRISWMAVSRSDADEIEITHLTMADGLATAQMRFRAINYET